MVEELTVRYSEQVTVILPSAEHGHGPTIALLPGVRIIERAVLDHRAFLEAGVPSARGLAILHQDDVGNFHAALRAQELNPDLRLVMAIFNTGLGERIRTFLTDCAVLSESSMAAPSFVAAALGEPAPSHVRLAGRTLYVARREDTSPDHLVCGLATDTDASPPHLVPPGDASAGLVLAVADGTPRNPLARQRRNPLRAAARVLRRLFGHKIGAAFAFLIAVLVCGFLLLMIAGRFSASNALYLTLLDAAGAAVSDPALPAPEKIAQTMLTFDGLAFLPLVTAAVVGARLTGSVHGRDRPLIDHVIVAGLGNVGTRVAGQLHDLGVDVVCIDKSESAAGVPLARRLGLKIVVGESHREETLREAGIASCQALVSVTSSDVVNLETALHARALNGPGGQNWDSRKGSAGVTLRADLSPGSAEPAGKTKEGLRMAGYELPYPFRMALPAAQCHQAGKAVRSAARPSASQRTRPAVTAARQRPGRACPRQEESLEHH
jgi:voltage-gated potassium channel Kch